MENDRYFSILLDMHLILFSPYKSLGKLLKFSDYRNHDSYAKQWFLLFYHFAYQLELVVLNYYRSVLLLCNDLLDNRGL